MSFEAR